MVLFAPLSSRNFTVFLGSLKAASINAVPLFSVPKGGVLKKNAD